MPDTFAYCPNSDETSQLLHLTCLDTVLPKFTRCLRHAWLEQVMIPDVKLKGVSRSTIPERKLSGKTETILKALEKVVRDMRHGL